MPTGTGRPAPGSNTLNVFVSYRWDEAQDLADRLRDEILERHPEYRVFVDVHEIPLGADFPNEVESRVEACDLVLALIGERWAKATDAQGRLRLHDPADFVRQELEAAINRGVQLIPVLIHDAKMPSTAEVPESLAPLLRREAIRLFRDYWPHGFEKLSNRLEEMAQSRAENPELADAEPDEAEAVVMRGAAVAGSADVSPRRVEQSQQEGQSALDQEDPPDLALALRVDSRGGSLELSVRELLDAVGHRQRLTSAAIGELEAILEDAGLHSRPPVKHLDLNGRVRLLRARSIPEFELRAEVEKSGSVTLAAEDLMRKFGRRRLTDGARQDIAEALDYSGLTADPALDLLVKQDIITLARSDPQ